MMDEARLREIENGISGTRKMLAGSDIPYDRTILYWVGEAEWLFFLVRDLQVRVAQVETWNDERLEDVDALVTERTELLKSKSAIVSESLDTLARAERAEAEVRRLTQASAAGDAEKIMMNKVRLERIEKIFVADALIQDPRPFIKELAVALRQAWREGDYVEGLLTDRAEHAEAEVKSMAEHLEVHEKVLKDEIKRLQEEVRRLERDGWKVINQDKWNALQAEKEKVEVELLAARTVVERLGNSLYWCLQYGSFETATDNPLHGRALDEAQSASDAYHALRPEAKKGESK